MNSYVLENENEAERLERQSQSLHYSYEEELIDFRPKLNGNIVDAGSGTGLVTRYLASRFPNAQVTGCEFSAARIEFARAQSQSYSNLHYRQENLMELKLESNSVDALVCRYVIEHFNEKSREQVLREFYRCLKPNAEICVIDTDGFIFNSYPQSPFVTQVCQKLEQEKPLDLNVGRKIPYLLNEQGFTDIQWRIETQVFQGESLAVEKGMIQERLNQSIPFLSSFLGSQSQAERFRDEYLTCLDTPGSTLFYNKFIVRAKKPGIRRNK